MMLLITNSWILGPNTLQYYGNQVAKRCGQVSGIDGMEDIYIFENVAIED